MFGLQLMESLFVAFFQSEIVLGFGMTMNILVSGLPQVDELLHGHLHD